MLPSGVSTSSVHVLWLTMLRSDHLSRGDPVDLQRRSPKITFYEVFLDLVDGKVLGTPVSCLAPALAQCVLSALCLFHTHCR